MKRIYFDLFIGANLKHHGTMTIPFNKAEHRALMAKINNSISESTDIVLMFRSIPYVDQIMRSHSSIQSAKWQQMTGIHEKEYFVNSTNNSGDMDNHQKKEIHECHYQLGNSD